MLNEKFKIQNGKEVTIKDMMGEKGMVIFFYPKAKTSGCTLEVREYQKEAQNIKELGYSVVGVSKDEIKLITSFSDENDVSYPLVSDIEHKLIDIFDVLKEKTMYGKKYKGIVRSTFVVDKDFNLIKGFDNVDPVEHIKEVINFLE